MVSVLLWLIGTVTVAPPAGAHTTGGLQPTDYRTVVRSVTPRIAGVSARAVDLGSSIELSSSARAEVTILGYDGEPYLRVGARGVYRNERSPAAFLNRSTKPTGGLPAGYDAKAEPRWRRIASGRTVRWHDHRAHWMGNSDPPAVRRDRSRAHVVIPDWRVPIRVGDRAASIRGSVVWVPPPTPTYWIVGAALLCVVVALAHRARFWRWVTVSALACLVAAAVVDVVGTWNASSASGGSKLSSSAYAVMSALLGTAVMIALTRSRWRRAIPAVLFAGFGLFVVSGVGNVGVWFASQLPTTAPDWLARSVPMIGLGVGAGLLIGSAMRLQPDEIEKTRSITS